MNRRIFTDLSAELEKMKFLRHDINLIPVDAPLFENLDMFVFILESIKFLEATENDLKAIEIEFNKLISFKYYCKFVKQSDNKILIVVSRNNSKVLYAVFNARKDLSKQIKSFR